MNSVTTKILHINIYPVAVTHRPCSFKFELVSKLFQRTYFILYSKLHIFFYSEADGRTRNNFCISCSWSIFILTIEPTKWCIKNATIHGYVVQSRGDFWATFREKYLYCPYPIFTYFPVLAVNTGSCPRVVDHW